MTKVNISKALHDIQSWVLICKLTVMVMSASELRGEGARGEMIGLEKRLIITVVYSLNSESAFLIGFRTSIHHSTSTPSRTVAHCG